MTKDWNQLTDDDLLNDSGRQSNEVIARYQRVMTKKTISALLDVRMGLHDVKNATNQSSKRIEAALQKAEKSSGKFQKATIALSIVIAIATVFYTIVTWQAVQVDKEANQIQRQMLELQKNANKKPSNKTQKATR